MKSLSTIFTWCVLAAFVIAEDKQPTAVFNDDIRPILSEHCFACHGPDSAGRKADLRLDVRDEAIESGAITPGKAKNSELLARVNSDDPEFMMPPPSFRKALTADQKRLLERWINEGATWQKHWAFIKPQRTDIPEPKGAKQWARGAIDRFVLQELLKLELQPNQPADRHTLARRTALDLTGLPPTKEMLDAFISDSSKKAFSKYVDQLLASKHAGEHRARYWLDAARYGDTHGMHVDNYREIWPYRDWVIRAFNDNMPFDKFVIEQIAGDLLPNPTLDQRIATGFSRCNITTSEGGAIPAELDVRYMVDRVETTSTVFLGLTAGCAVCHDHKYDPLSQREFYQLGAFFNNTTQPAMDGNQKDTPPVVTLPADEFKEEWNSLLAQREQLRTELNSYESDVSKWWDSNPQSIDHLIADDGLILSLPLCEGKSDLPEGTSWATDHPIADRGVRFTNASKLSAKLPKLRSDEPLTISFWLRTPDRVMSSTVFDQTETKDKKTVGWRVTSNTQGALSFQMFDSKGKNIKGNLPDNEALRPRSWQHVCIRYSGGQSNSSISILANGRAAALRNSSESLIEPCELANVPLKIGTRLATAALSDIRIFQRWVSDEEVRLLASEHRLKQLFEENRKKGTPWSDLNPFDQSLLTTFYNQTENKSYQEKSRPLSATQRRRDFIYSRSTTTLVMQERPTKPQAWILQRGEYDQPLEKVAPGLPSVLNFYEQGWKPTNRLDLAKWLADPNHPLTARVMVNRLWQSIFGTGLVKTSEDFGVMGDRPSHPELLDWLAVEFVESGWNVKHILKLMVTSATYQQSSHVTPEKLRIDAANRFLSRGPRLRLDAEVLRDQALAVSGLLKRQVGGASVKPYQPDGLWNVVAITGSNTRVFKRDSGEALYRRSLYTFWKRTSPPPSMAAFNAPTREQCTVRRERTNTPLQALVLMNDPQFVEAARRLAEKAIEKNKDDQSRAEWMLTAVFSRPAKEIDISEMAATAVELGATFKQTPEMAKELINTGDSKPNEKLDASQLAAWTMVANTLMNRDDFITK